MTGESTTGTADEAAAARESRTALRSEQMTSKTRWLKTNREPVEMSVADARMSGPLPRVEVAEGRVVEQDLVVQLGRQLRPTPGRRPQLAPVGRTEGAGDDLALHVALQEALLVFGEQLVAVEAVGQCREAAARHAGDDVDGVEQAGLAPRCRDLGAPQELQNPIGERGRARAAAGKGEDDEVRFPGPGRGPGASRNGSRFSGRPA